MHRVITRASWMRGRPVSTTYEDRSLSAPPRPTKPLTLPGSRLPASATSSTTPHPRTPTGKMLSRPCLVPQVKILPTPSVCGSQDLLSGRVAAQHSVQLSASSDSALLEKAPRRRSHAINGRGADAASQPPRALLGATASGCLSSQLQQVWPERNPPAAVRCCTGRRMRRSKLHAASVSAACIAVSRSSVVCINMHVHMLQMSYACSPLWTHTLNRPSQSDMGLCCCRSTPGTALTSSGWRS